MKNMRLLLLTAALFGVNHAASADMLANDAIQIRLIGSPYVTLQNTWASASTDKAQTMVFGHIARNRAPFSGGGFVDATVIDANGRVLQAVRSNYIPRGSRKEREYLSRYQLALGDVPAGARVQLSYSRALTGN